MNEKELLERISAIEPLDEQMMAAAEQQLDRLTKPPGSLGKLETLARQVAGITGLLQPDLSKRAVIVMAGDHGVCAEGVSAFPPEVTPQMVANIVAGGAAVNVLARQARADVVCVDIGVNAVLPASLQVASDQQSITFMDRKVRAGTANMTQEAAMSRAEVLLAITAGVDIVTDLAAVGYRMFATGEMGIGNTTASAALCAVLADMSADEAVGLGTGIDEPRRQHKIKIVSRAIARNHPNPADPLEVLAKVGGLEIAGLVGVILGAAMNKSLVVVDGFISSAAALVAIKLAPQARPYILASHLSLERGHQRLLEAIKLVPMIHMDMRLGEGTGAVLCFHFIDAAMLLMHEMATFESAGIAGSNISDSGV